MKSHRRCTKSGFAFSHFSSRFITLALLFMAVALWTTPTHAARVAWNVDIHQNKFPDYANDFHVWGTLEDSFGVPVFVGQVNFQVNGPGGAPIPPPVGAIFNTFNQSITPSVTPGFPSPPFYDFNATWKDPNHNLPFCTWMHFGIEFNTSHNFEAHLRGTWTRDGVDPAYNAIYGFEVPMAENQITVHNESTVTTTPQQMDMMILSPDMGAKFPVASLTTSFFDDHPEWTQQFHSVPAALLPAIFDSGTDLTVSFSQVSGMRALNPGEVLITRIKSSYATTTGGGGTSNGADVFWEYIMHGAPATTSAWNGMAVTDNWTNGSNWGGTPPAAFTELQFGPIAGGHASNLNDFPVATQFNGIRFLPGAPSYALQGNSIVLGGPVVNQSVADQTIALPLTLTPGGNAFETATSAKIVVAQPISESSLMPGGVTLVKNGPGELVLTAANAFTGGSMINAGIVTATNSSSLGTGTVSLGAATLNLATATLPNPVSVQSAASTISSTVDTTLTGALSGAGSLTKTGPFAVTLTNISNIGGTVTVSNGSLVLVGSLTAAQTQVAPGATLNIPGTLVTGNWTNVGTDIIQPTGVANVANDLIVGNAAGAASFFDIFGQVTVGGTTTVNPGATLEVKSGGKFTTPIWRNPGRDIVRGTANITQNLFVGDPGAAVDSFFDVYTEVTVGNTTTVYPRGTITVNPGGKFQTATLAGGGGGGGGGALVNSGDVTLTLKTQGWTTAPEARHSIKTLTMNTGATLELQNNLLSVDYGTGPSPYADLAQKVNAGAIKQSTSHPNRTVGIHDTGSSVLVGYASPGDSMLRGRVDSSDIVNILAAGKFGVGPSNARWVEGDFTHDSQVSSADILAILAAGTYNAGTYGSGGSPGGTVNSIITGPPSAARATIIYDPTTGDIKIDPNGNTMTGFRLLDSSVGASFFNATAASFPPGGAFTTDNTAEKFWSTFTPGNYLVATWDLGNIAATNLTAADFTNAFNNAAGDTIWTKNGGGSVDFNINVVPEPGIPLTLLAGLTLLLRRRRHSN